MKSTKLIICLFIISLLILVYYPVINYNFINYDDYEYVVENPFVNSGLTVSGIKWALFSSHASNWHPITWLSHMLDIDLFGLDAGGHHFSNLLLHAINSLLLFFLLCRLTGQMIPSGFVAVLFALHPLNVESVAWIAERKNLLSTLFLFCALIAYYYYSKNLKFSNYLLSIFLFWLGLMSKPMLVTLPFLLFLIDYWPINRFKLNKKFHLIKFTKNNYSLFIEKIPFFILSGISIFITLLVQKDAIGSETSYPLILRINTAIVSYGCYIWKMFFPFNLALPYPYPEKVSFVSSVISLTLLLAMTLIVLYNIKKRQFLFVGWSWYLITLIPAIGIIQVGVQSMADRYAYVPFIGLFVMFSWVLYNLSKKRGMGKVVFYTIFVFSINYLGLATFNQVKYWKNSITLFKHTIAATENNYVAHNNLGEALFKSGSTNAAMRHYKRALEINPNFAMAYLNIGVAQAAQDKDEKALQNYFNALKLNPHYTQALCNIGNVYLREGQYKKAYHYYLQALKYNPNASQAYNGIGAVFVNQGQIEKAVSYFKQALSINPNNQSARNNLNELLKLKRTKTKSKLERD